MEERVCTRRGDMRRSKWGFLQTGSTGEMGVRKGRRQDRTSPPGAVIKLRAQLSVKGEEGDTTSFLPGFFVTFVKRVAPRFLPAWVLWL